MFIPLEDPPRWLDWVGDVFPLKPFVTSFQDAFNPGIESMGIPWANIGVLLAWGALGVVGAVRFFSWEPNSGRRELSRASARDE